MRNTSGFTIHELMTTIAVIAIMAGIAVPNLIGSLPDYRMRSAADEMVSVMWLAQKRAVRENSPVALAFDFANDSYLVFIDNGPTIGVQDVGELTIASGGMPAGIDLKNDDAPDDLGSPVVFDRRGFPGSSGNIVVDNGDNRQTIMLTLGGGARTQ